MRNFFLSFLIIFSLTLHSCKKDTVRLNGYAIEGIDVSHHQKDIQWDSLINQNLKFVYMKATEGVTHTDTKFDYNWNEARRIGLKRGAYHFYTIDADATEQAKHFIETVKLEDGDLPPVLDFEHERMSYDASLPDSLSLWLSLIENYFNVKPIIYTNLKLYNTYIKNHFDKYPLWIARYNNIECPIPGTSSPYIWQYGNRGRLSGINGHVDFNIFLGSQTDFDNLCLNTKDKNLK